jgi:hypothetical protein
MAWKSNLAKRTQLLLSFMYLGDRFLPRPILMPPRCYA